MRKISRRDLLRIATTAGVVAGSGCSKKVVGTTKPSSEEAPAEDATSEQVVRTPTVDPVLGVRSLPASGPWPTADPFLFCVHHNDTYPAGNADLGPAVSLSGRHLGQDFANIDGWNMYHGMDVPGFPRHPHRGFETVTLVRRGLIDHSDSMGAAARYGDGDVQWLTAGDGIMHAEMFPLLHRIEPNPTDFFQIWVNLPAARKRVPPHFSMFWRQMIPVVESRDTAGRSTTVTVVAGRYLEHNAPAPPPNSWAATDNDVAIWTIDLSAKASWTLPAARSDSQRSLYVVRGAGIRVGDHTVGPRTKVDLKPDVATVLVEQGEGTELLLLQGRPIGEPVVQHGPFVMNTREEIQQAIRDYQRTRFGDWAWDRDDPIHGAKYKRFARFIDGTEDVPG
ncbi:MAG: pirin [Myxococcales bacterium]|nr:pirin [Myxococcales bacterium]